MSDDGVRKLLAEFVEAFNNLEWEKFVSCFTSDATVFMSYTTVATRTTVVDAFQSLFEKARSRPGPPYLNISPEDLRLEIVPGLALASFHLRGLAGRPPNEVGRRTAVLRNETGIWRICHLHVSTQAEASG